MSTLRSATVKFNLTYRLPIVQGTPAALLTPTFAVLSSMGSCPTILAHGKLWCDKSGFSLRATGGAVL